MIDFHSHILPKIDDGSRSAEESCQMLDLLYEQGITQVVATPHFIADNESVEHFLNRRAASYEVLHNVRLENKPEILLGAEVKYYQGISRLEKLGELCVEKTNLLLLEMPVCRWTEYTVKEIIDISATLGLSVVLAHVERCLFLQSEKTVERLLESGIHFQVNAQFFTQRFSRRKALKMLKQQKISFIGSDCHNLTDRAPLMGEALAAIEKKFSKDLVIRFDEYTKDLINQ